MTKEFFVSAWIKKRPVIYALSHMFIIPLVDIYASGMDWLREDVHAPTGLLFFFIVSYLNGLVLEVGRKIKVPKKDEINTYSTLYGINRATIIWLGILFIDLICSITASVYAGLGNVAIIILIILFLFSSIPAWLFLKHKTEKLSKQIENFSGYWTMAMYLTLGGIPMVTNLTTLWF
jgi:4-hydroxybenzoate polyprenyltransferase